MSQDHQHPQTICDNTQSIDLSKQIIIIGSIQTEEQWFDDDYTQQIHQKINQLVVDKYRNLEDVSNKFNYYHENIQQTFKILETNMNIIKQKQIEKLILQVLGNNNYIIMGKQLKKELYISGNQGMTFLVENCIQGTYFQNPYIIQWGLQNRGRILQKIKNSNSNYLTKIINLEIIETLSFFNQYQFGKFNECCTQNSGLIYCLEMEASQTNLEKIIQLKNQEGNKFSFNEVLKIFNDCAQGLLELDELNILHRNLYAKNILIVNDIAKISDFHLSIEKELLQESRFQSSEIPIVAPEYINKGQQLNNVDMNSLGHIFKQLMEVSENNQKLNSIIELMVQVNTQLNPKQLCKELQKLCQQNNIEQE